MNSSSKLIRFKNQGYDCNVENYVRRWLVRKSKFGRRSDRASELDETPVSAMLQHVLQNTILIPIGKQFRIIFN